MKAVKCPVSREVTLPLAPDNNQKTRIDSQDKLNSANFFATVNVTYRNKTREDNLYFSSDEKANVIIGEAAMNLIEDSQEVNVELLMGELLAMSASEVDENRLEQLQQVRQWLKSFKTIGARNTEQAGWLSNPLNADKMSTDSADDIVFKG